MPLMKTMFPQLSVAVSERSWVHRIASLPAPLPVGEGVLPDAFHGSRAKIFVPTDITNRWPQLRTWLEFWL